MRHFVSTDDFSNFEIQQLFRLSDQVKSNLATWSGFCAGKVLATLFFEPSTRTRLSFESAMARLDGRTLGFTDPSASSVAKGETLADTTRMVSNYADLIVVRHHLAGAAQVMADYASVPVINGGDGAHSHPTQALIDLYTIQNRKGDVADLTIGICGDLRYSRSAHSLSKLIARFGGRQVHVAPDGFHMPDWILNRIQKQHSQKPVIVEQLPEIINQLDVIYVNRLQEERLPSEVDPIKARTSYQLNAEIMKAAKDSAIIMHPLPRVNELALELDTDPRAAYFEQSSNGVPLRMALIASLQGLEHLVLTDPPLLRTSRKQTDVVCKNDNCITFAESYVVNEIEPNGACIYCETII